MGTILSPCPSWFPCAQGTSWPASRPWVCPQVTLGGGMGSPSHFPLTSPPLGLTLGAVPSLGPSRSSLIARRRERARGPRLPAPPNMAGHHHTRGVSGAAEQPETAGSVLWAEQVDETFSWGGSKGLSTRDAGTQVVPWVSGGSVALRPTSTHSSPFYPTLRRELPHPCGSEKALEFFKETATVRA